MRSVFFHLTDTTRQEIAGFLSTFAASNDSTEWIMPADGKSPVFYIRFWDDISSEVEPDHMEALTAALGGTRVATLMVDVSGRIPGDIEVLEFASVVLDKFRGVAWDDYTYHCWTLVEIQSGANVQGHSFFDYSGWYQEKPIRPALPEGWHYPDEETAQLLHAELLRELPLGHLMHGKSVMTFAWRDDATDDVLFRHIDEPERFTVIHLSWLGRTEINAEHPSISSMVHSTPSSQKRNVCGGHKSPPVNTRPQQSHMAAFLQRGGSFTSSPTHPSASPCD